MENTDLFKFGFVDRCNQTQKVKDCLKPDSSKHVIWVHGEHGAGKSYFIKHILETIPSENVAHIELKAEEQSTNCIKVVLEKINEVSKISSFSFFQKNYKLISKLAHGIISSVIEQVTKIDISSFFDMLLDSNQLFTRNSEEQQNNVKFITSYIDTVLTERGLLIVIDNFSLCDRQSFEVLINIIQYYSSNHEKNIFFILCTSDGESLNDIEHQLQEKVVLEPIEILPFDSYQYFSDILIKIFNLTVTTEHTVRHVFEFCQGYPAKLNQFIHMLYSKNGISFSETSERADWNENVINEIIYNNCSEYTLKDMDYTERMILYIISEFHKIVTIEVLIDLAKYLHNKILLLCNEKEDDIYSAIQKLHQNGIIKIFYEENKCYIKFEHDLTYYSFKQQIAKDPIFPMVNSFFFEYIIEHEDELQNHGFTSLGIAELLALHSYRGQTTNWMTYTISYGRELFKNGNYYSASEIFERLKNSWNYLDNAQKLMLGECFFCSGDYTSADAVLGTVTEPDINTLFPYYLLVAQVKNLLMKKENAVEIIDNNLLPGCKNEKEWLVAQNLKQRILSNVKGRRNEAKALFDKVKKQASAELKVTDIYGRFLMGTIEYYRGNIAEQDLLVAEKIAHSTNNQYLLATLYTNMGFHEFWRGNISFAKDNFHKSQKLLATVRNHEMSYPLNNLGICYLMEGNIEEAMKCAHMGLLWNKSKYVEITLNTLLMVCYAIKQDFKYEYFLDLLEHTLSEKDITDISIHLKVNFAIGFVHKCIGDLGRYDEYREKTFAIAKQYYDDALPFIWFEKYDDNIEHYISKHVDKEKYKYFYEHRFEPWLVTLNHD